MTAAPVDYCQCGRGPVIGIVHCTATRMWFRALGDPLEHHPDFGPDAVCVDCVADTAARIASGEVRADMRRAVLAARAQRDAQPPAQTVQRPAGAFSASQSLLTKNHAARKGNSMTLPVPGENGIPKNAVVHGACKRWWTGAERSHASCCHRTFSSLSAFDQHRKGGRCNDPADMGLVARVKPFGELWGWPAPVGGYGALYSGADTAGEAA